MGDLAIVKGRSAPREEAEKVALEILQEMEHVGLISNYAIVGSCRRKAEVVNDVDVVIQPINSFAVDTWFVQMFGRKSNHLPRSRGIIGGIQFDFYCAGRHEWGTHLFTLTGPHNFYRKARKKAEELGRKLDKHGVWQGGTRIAGRFEKEVFLSLGIPYIPPNER
jgi:DNA polymerase (family 10)